MVLLMTALAFLGLYWVRRQEEGNGARTMRKTAQEAGE